MATPFVISAAILAALCGQCLAYPDFQTYLPNGRNVPHPCKANYMWPGVGHLNRLGASALNVFGEAFRQNNYQWNSDLCWADSDGDGWTNGYELGDPNCMWTVGALPERSYNISHPGICDPLGSEQCEGKNDFVDCSLEELSCPSINKTGVMKIDLQFTEHTIPATETNYYCMTFDLPDDQDYHVVANEPIIDNADVLHHILVYGCDDDDTTEILQPQLCGMEAEGECGTIIGLWTVGSPGGCYDDVGYRIGKSTYKRVKVEVHYNNPWLREGQTDKSGISMYYQPASDDVEDLTTITLGTQLFEIPPGEREFKVSSVCKGSCTEVMITKPAKLWGAVNHMHYMGHSMMIELFRGGEMIDYITNDERYNYDSPILHLHEPRIDLLPGDELRTTCIFNSLYKDKYVRYGDGTSDEMCFGFLFAYPRDAFSFQHCISFDTLDICDAYGGAPLETSMGYCNWGAFTHFGDGHTPAWTQELEDHCSNDGYCRSKCREIVERMLKEEPCASSEASQVVDWRLRETEDGLRALSTLNKCRAIIWAEQEGDTHGGDHSKQDCDWDDCSQYCEYGHGETYDTAGSNMAATWLVTLCAAVLCVLGYARV